MDRPVIALTPVEKSSNIAAHGYDPERSVLEIQFKGGSRYQYDGVPPELYAEMQAAESLGRFFQQRIRGQFDTTKVGDQEKQQPDTAPTPEADPTGLAPVPDLRPAP